MILLLLIIYKSTSLRVLKVDVSKKPVYDEEYKWFKAVSREQHYSVKLYALKPLPSRFFLI